MNCLLLNTLGSFSLLKISNQIHTWTGSEALRQCTVSNFSPPPHVGHNLFEKLAEWPFNDPCGKWGYWSSRTERHWINRAEHRTTFETCSISQKMKQAREDKETMYEIEPLVLFCWVLTDLWANRCPQFAIFKSAAQCKTYQVGCRNKWEGFTVFGDLKEYVDLDHKLWCTVITRRPLQPKK